MPRLFFTALSSFDRLIASTHRLIGQCLSVFTLLMAALVAVVIVLRVFDLGSIALQESITYLHGALFMLCLGFAGVNQAHVRVDICYRRYSPITRAWVNLLGSILFLLPFSIFLTAISFNAALHSWQVRESSINAGGLPFVYLLKALPPLAGLLLCLYALSDIGKQLLAISFISSEIDSEIDDA